MELRQVAEILTRLGFAARGLMYLTIGYMALRLGRTESNEGALQFLNTAAGSIMLGLMSVGFVGYGLWRLLEALLDGENNGRDAKGIAKRIAGAVSGLIHLGFAWTSIRLATQAGQSGKDHTEQSASTAVSLAGDTTILVIGAGILLAVGAYQVVKAIKLTFLKHLTAEAARQTWVAWVGRAGYLSRGAVFVMISLFLWRARNGDLGQVGGLEQALDSFPYQIRYLVAVGLFMFGVFSLVEAMYRRISKRAFGAA